MKFGLHAKTSLYLIKSLIIVALIMVMPSQSRCFAAKGKLPSTATIELMDGSIYELAELFIQNGTPTGQFYTVYDNYKTEALILRKPHNTSGWEYFFTLYFDLKDLDKIILGDDHKSVVVELKDGRRFEGAIETYYLGDQKLYGFSGLVTIEGYPAEFSLKKFKIGSIKFSHNDKNEVVATVMETDGKTTENIKKPKFVMGAGDSRGRSVRTNEISFKIGKNTLKIPVADVVSITPFNEEGKEYIVKLRNGKELKGEKPRFGINGKTKAYGRDAKFDSSFSLTVKSIYFNGTMPPKIKKKAIKPKKIVVPDIKITSKKWAVIIGVSDYSDTRIPQLRYASADAIAFHKWIISPNGGKYSPANVKMLINNDATGRNIKNALYVWLKQALEEDMVTIYFAGHGSPESPDSPNNLFLLPHDARYDDIATTGFPMWDVETALKRFIKAKKVVVIADACHSAGVGQLFDISRRTNRDIKVNPISSGIQSLSAIGDGICVISASDEKQFSQESKKWGGGHGVFTYFLLNGLGGEADYNKDNNVTLGELIPYLSEKVRRATKNSQSPTVAGKFDPALTIGR